MQHVSLRVCFAVALSCPALLFGQAITTTAAGTVSVYRSPNGGAQEAVLEAIEAARRSILVQAYTFTSPPIYRALAEAKARGVDVRVLVDKVSASRDFRGDGARYDIEHGVPLRVDYLPGRGIAHNKVMIIDSDTVLTGSFNWSRAAETTNVENLIVFRHSPVIARAYTQEWTERAQHALPIDALPAASGGSSED